MYHYPLYFFCKDASEIGSLQLFLLMQKKIFSPKDTLLLFKIVAAHIEEHLTTYFRKSFFFFFCIERGLYSVYFKEMNSFEKFIF